MKTTLKAVLFCLCMACYPLNAQNIKSIEISVPNVLCPSFVYGFDYHPQWYTQLKPGVGVTFGSYGSVALLNFSAEQRYYYNMPRRLEREKRTQHKSADFISLKPSMQIPFYLNHGKPGKEGYVCAVTINWGMRRAIGQRCYIDGSIGYGPAYFKKENIGINDWGWDKTTSGWINLPEINLGFGIALGHKH